MPIITERNAIADLSAAASWAPPIGLTPAIALLPGVGYLGRNYAPGGVDLSVNGNPLQQIDKTNGRSLPFCTCGPSAYFDTVFGEAAQMTLIGVARATSTTANPFPSSIMGNYTRGNTCLAFGSNSTTGFIYGWQPSSVGGSASARPQLNVNIPIASVNDWGAYVMRSDVTASGGPLFNITTGTGVTGSQQNSTYSSSVQPAAYLEIGTQPQGQSQAQYMAGETDLFAVLAYDAYLTDEQMQAVFSSLQSLTSRYGVTVVS